MNVKCLSDGTSLLFFCVINNHIFINKITKLLHLYLYERKKVNFTFNRKSEILKIKKN